MCLQSATTAYTCMYKFKCLQIITRHTCVCINSCPCKVPQQQTCCVCMNSCACSLPQQHICVYKLMCLQIEATAYMMCMYAFMCLQSTTEHNLGNRLLMICQQRGSGWKPASCGSGSCGNDTHPFMKLCTFSQLGHTDLYLLLSLLHTLSWNNAQPPNWVTVTYICSCPNYTPYHEIMQPPNWVTVTYICSCPNYTPFHDTMQPPNWVTVTVICSCPYCGSIHAWPDASISKIHKQSSCMTKLLW